MPDPWDIIGWTIVSTGAALTILYLVGALVRSIRLTVRWTRLRWLHLRTRDIAPAEGQRWVSGDDRSLYVRGIYPTHVAVGTAPPGHGYSGASWGDKWDEWRERVRDGRYYLDGHAGDGRDPNPFMLAVLAVDDLARTVADAFRRAA